MVFSSISFLVFFLPCLLLVYFLIPRRLRQARNLVLLAFSLFFYGWGGAKYLLLLGASILINYACGYACGFSKKAGKAAVLSAVILQIGLMIYFKYAGFFAEIINSLGANAPIPQIALPIGISFFTFQGLSYVFDVYRGDASVQKNPLKVALYVSLFPQLVAGPIVRYTTVEEAIDDRTETRAGFADGAVRFLLGLGKKMLLANTMGAVADEVFSTSVTGMAASLAWTGAIAYTMQIYFDFSAYSDMAIGLGRMFGFEFLENFNYPYVSRSITEFWRRWHISLSTWFRDYVYIPLGGNRCGKAKHIRNIIIVWLLTGLWHGAAWTYVLWGLWFCFLLLGEKYVWGRALEKLPSPVRWLYSMLLVMLSWVIFRSDGMGYALGFVKAMFGGQGAAYDAMTAYLLRQYAPEFIICLIAIFPVKDAARKFLEHRAQRAAAELAVLWGPRLMALASLLLSYMLLASGSFNPFIYFQF